MFYHIVNEDVCEINRLQVVEKRHEKLCKDSLKVRFVRAYVF